MRALLVLLWLFCEVSLLCAEPLPWDEGETLTYEIHWGLFIAAEATFTANRDDADQWNFHLRLNSRGVVNTLYPMDSAFASTLSPQPWRSVGFRARRHEGGKDKAYQVSISYPDESGTFTNLIEKSEQQFDVPHDAVDDLLSILYSLRRYSWESISDCEFRVYEDRKVKEGKVVRVRKTKLKDAKGKQRECWLLEGKEVGDIGDKRRVISRIWLTADERRLPLRAECQARFGTFRMTLVNR
jgi:hypothetical protein